VIHALGALGLFQLPVDFLGPHLAHGFDFHAGRRQTLGKPLGVRPFDGAFFPQALCGYLAGGGQQVGVPVTVVAFLVRLMERHVHCTAVPRGQAMGEADRQLLPGLCGATLIGERATTRGRSETESGR